MNIKLIKSIFLLFLGVLLVTVALATVTQPVSAQCNPQTGQGCCPDPQNPGKYINCPQQQPTEQQHRKKTPTPQRRPTKTPTPTATFTPTSTPTTVPQPYPYPYPYPNPYPYPYPGGGGGGLGPVNPPILVCFFCDKPWLWGVLTGVIFVIVAGILIGLLRLPALGGGIIGPIDLPGGTENYTMTVRNVNGDGELVPAVQRVREAANSAGDVHVKLDGLDSDAGNAFAKNFSNNPGDVHVKIDNIDPGNAFIKGE